VFERCYFVLAPNFHGATLLSKLLNAHPDVASLGDTYPSNQFDQLCGCGRKVSECLFWQEVGNRVGAERYRDYPNLLPHNPKIVGGPWDKYLFNLLGTDVLRSVITESKRNAFATDYGHFLEVVAEMDQSHSKVFVDGVKSISRVKAMIASGGRVDGVIHLIRDPGDFTQSWMRQSRKSLAALMRSALVWRMYHRQARKLRNFAPYLEIHYEDLADDADSVLREIFLFLGVPVESVENLRSNMSREWHFMGNASLFRFDGSIRRSRHESSLFEKLLVRSLSGSGPVGRSSGRITH
jgi:hypothetical protein